MSFDLFGMLEQSQATGIPLDQGLNLSGMSNRQRNNTRSGSPRTPRQPSPRRSEGFATPMIDPTDLMAANHFAQGARMVKDTNEAIQDEMDRRVAISREQRRMALELEKKRMDQETERMKTEALLKRLESASGMQTIYH